MDGWKELSPAELAARGIGPKGPLSAPPNAAKNEQTMRETLNPPTFPEREHARIQGGMQEILTKGGMAPEQAQREAERVGKKIPGTWGDIAGAAIPMLTGLLLPEGRTPGRIMGQVGANIFGRGALDAGIAAATGGNVVGAGLSGAAKGVLPGLAQGAVGALHGPTKDTMDVQKAIQGIQKSVSPAVAKVLDIENPAALLSRAAIRKMKKAASETFAATEGTLDADLTGFNFSINNTPMQFAQLRKQIRELRDVGDRQWQSPIMADRARKSVRKAAQMERDMVEQLRAAGKNAQADQYEKAIAQYAADSDAVRWVRGLHQQEQLMGGVNAQDRPGLAEAQKALKSTGRASGALHGAIGAVELAAGKPGSAGWQFGRAADTIRGGPLKPAQSAPQRSPWRNLTAPGPLAGSATAGGQSLLLQRPESND